MEIFCPNEKSRYLTIVTIEDALEPGIFLQQSVSSIPSNTVYIEVK